MVGTVTYDENGRRTDIDISQYDYLHILNETNKGYGFVVKGYDTYPRHSVLAGQTRISFIDSFMTLEQAKAAYPEATLSNKWIEPYNTFDHLPDDADY